MSRTAIRAERLGKRYRIGKREPYRTLRETLSNSLRLRSLGKSRDQDSPETFWALRDVSFEVHQGEVVGIIGRNGAGKSTLLKVLSRITTPTEGYADLEGVVRPLLEVGTGFHPELTGRDNIYLSGAVLGMSRAEILRKLDEIVAFAEVEKFIDTPVKRYSSGMYLRLAFSVAAHLEPDILIVDEVLAVGDASFQRKCLGKMSEVAGEGRTVLFVSHNMDAITRLCGRAMMLSEGAIVRDGPAAEVISFYLTSDLGSTSSRSWDDIGTAPGDQAVKIRSIRMRDEAGSTSQEFDIRKPIGAEVEFDVLEEGWVLQPNVAVTSGEGVRLFTTIDLNPAWRSTARPTGRFRSTVWIPGNFLAEGAHTVSVAISTFNPTVVHLLQTDVVSFHVYDPMEGDSARGDHAGSMGGVVRPLLTWNDVWVADTTEGRGQLPAGCGRPGRDP